MSSQLSYFLQQSINGISVGSIYAMIAIGYSMVYGLLYLINFAHGDLYVFGTFIAFTFLTSLSGVVHPLICCALGAIGAGIIGVIIERFAYRPVRGGSRNVPMISALGAAAVLKTLAQVIWGPESIPFPSLLPSGVIEVAGLKIYMRCIVVVAVAICVVLIMQIVVKYTKFGRGTRFIMQDITTASLMGVNVNFIIPMVYALGGFLGVLGGVLYSSYYSLLNIDMGILGTIKAWAVVTLGGPGSFIGALLGGLILGWSESMAGAYFNNALRDAVGYLVIVAVLMVKPTGLFNSRREEKV